MFVCGVSFILRQHPTAFLRREYLSLVEAANLIRDEMRVEFSMLRLHRQ